MLVVYASRGGNVASLVNSLNVRALNIDEAKDLKEDYILFTYTDGLGEVPWEVEEFLNEHSEHLKGVIASGDILSHDAARRVLAETGATAVMVARGTYGNPWVFSGHEPSASERIAAFECHVRLLEATGAHLKRARSLAGWYFKGMPDAARWRNAAMGCVRAEEFLAVAAEVRAHVL